MTCGAGCFGMHNQHRQHKAAWEGSRMAWHDPGTKQWCTSGGGGNVHVFALLLRAVAVDGDCRELVLEQEVLDGIRVALFRHEHQRQALRTRTPRQQPQVACTMCILDQVGMLHINKNTCPQLISTTFWLDAVLQAVKKCLRHLCNAPPILHSRELSAETDQ